MRFTCPRCGSHEYGTENAVTNPIRRCAGRYNVDRAANKTRPCDFEWPPEDDHKWGLGPPIALTLSRARETAALLAEGICGHGSQTFREWKDLEELAEKLAGHLNVLAEHARAQQEAVERAGTLEAPHG